MVQIIFGNRNIALEHLAVWGVSPSCQTHEGLLGVGPLVNDLGGRLACGGEVQVILNDFVEELSFLAVAPIIAAALLEDIGDLLVGTALARPYLPDPFQQLIEIVLPESAAVFELGIINDEALDDEFPQRRRGPDAEVGGLERIDPIAYGDCCIEVVVFDLTPDLAPALALNDFHFGNSCAGREFTTFVDVFEVLADCRRLDPEEIGHDFLGEPEIIPGEKDIDRHFAVSCLIQDDLGWFVVC